MRLPLGEIPSRLASAFHRNPQDGLVHLTPTVDRKVGLNGNVRNITPLKGSLSVDTQVAHVSLDKPIRVGKGSKSVVTSEIVVKYLPELEVPHSAQDIRTMKREAQAYRRPWHDPLGDRLPPGTVYTLRNNHGQKVPVVVMPFIEGTTSLRRYLRDGNLSTEEQRARLGHALKIQGEALDLTVSAMQSRQVRTPFMRRRMELVSMKRLEREIIWRHLEGALRGVEEFYTGEIPEGRLRNAELIFAQRNKQTGEMEWVSYGSINQMQQRMGRFLDQEPVIMAEGIDHDTSMKNAEIYESNPPEHVRLDKGYRARMRSPLARLLLRRGEVIDGAEAIFYAGKAVSLETLQNLGEVKVQYVESKSGDKLLIDATGLQFSPIAEEFEARMQAKWPEIADRLGYPQLIQHLKGWEAMSDFYEFIHAGEKVNEVLDNGEQRSRPDAGLLMLQRLGQALAEHDALESKFVSSDVQGRRSSRNVPLVA